LRVEPQAQRVAVVVADRALGLPGGEGAERRELGDEGRRRCTRPRSADVDLRSDREAVQQILPHIEGQPPLAGLLIMPRSTEEVSMNVARFCRSSLQRGWITSEEGRVLEDVFVSNAKQTIYFLGRPQMVEESGNTLVASPFQPLFHVRHGVGGSEQAPLNLWSIVLLTDAPDPRYCEPFKQVVRAGLLPGFIEIYIERDLKLKLNRI